MTRTNIDIDDTLHGEVMRQHGLRSKREAVDFALRRVVGVPLTTEFLRSLRGIGWGADLDELLSADDTGVPRDPG